MNLKRNKKRRKITYIRRVRVRGNNDSLKNGKINQVKIMTPKVKKSKKYDPRKIQIN